MDERSEWGVGGGGGEGSWEGKRIRGGERDQVGGEASWWGRGEGSGWRIRVGGRGQHGKVGVGL